MPRRSPAKQRSAPATRFQHPLVIRLRRYAAVFGNFEAPLLRAAREINALASIDDAEMYKRVMDAVGKGCHTVDDLIDETELNTGEVRRICEQLIFEGKYHLRPLGQTYGARGRKTTGIFHVDDPDGKLTDEVAAAVRMGHYDNFFDTPDEEDT